MKHDSLTYTYDKEKETREEVRDVRKISNHHHKISYTMMC